MDTPTPVAPAEFVRNMQDFKKSTADDLHKNARALEDLQKAVQGLSEFQAQAAMAADVPTGNSENRDFVAIGEDEVKSKRSAYIANDKGAVRLFGHRDSRGAYRPGLLDDNKPRSAYQAELQAVMARRAVVRMALRASSGRRSDQDVSTPIMDRELARTLRHAPAELGALREVGERIWADSAAIGADFVPDLHIAGFARQVELTPSIAQLFAQRDAPASGILPYVSSRIRPHSHGIPTSDNPSNDPMGSLATGQNPIVPVSQVAGAQIHRDSEEDAIISVADTLMNDLRWSLVAGTSDAIINGHNVAQASHQDDLDNWGGRFFGTGTVATDHRLWWNGLRRLAFAKSTASNLASVEASANIAISLVALLDPAHAMNEVVIVMSPEYFLGQGRKFTEFVTWDKVGANATILTGMFGQSSGPLPNQVGYLFGYPVVVEATLTADLNASGVYDNTTTTKTGILAVDRSRYLRWKRKDAMVETDVEIRNNTRVVIARKRDTFQEQLAVGTENNVAYGYNIAPS